MGDNIWWVAPPRNYEAGGYTRYAYHSGSLGLVYRTQWYRLGYDCEKGGIAPWCDLYESRSYQTFVKFQNPLLGGTFESANLHIMIGVGEYVDSIRPAYVKLKCQYKAMYTPEWFPWDRLTSADYHTLWADIGEFGNFADLIEDYWSNETDPPDYGRYWVKLDVTAAVQCAIDNSWDWVAFRLKPSYLAPINWDYCNRPLLYDQRCYIGIPSPTNQCAGEHGSSSTNKPEGFPADLRAHSGPWLELTYSGGAEQPAPGEYGSSHVHCVAADPKARMAIAGVDAGSLWYCWSGGALWAKVFEVDEAITAVYMDKIRNFQDYPNEEISWFGTTASGTASGEVYKSIDSFGIWDLKKTFDHGIVEILGSNVNASRVAVGEGNSVWVTLDGGDTWSQAYTSSNSFDGMFVREDEIQAVFGNEMVRSDDFGSTWYEGTSEPSGADIGFDQLNPERSFIVAGGSIYATQADFDYSETVSLLGSGIVTDGDYESSIMYIGTSISLYKTVDFGQSVNVMKDIDVTDIALGGNRVIGRIIVPNISGLILYPTGDFDIDTCMGTWGAIKPSVEEPPNCFSTDPPTYYCNCTYWSMVRYEDATWTPNGVDGCGATFGCWDGKYIYVSWHNADNNAIFNIEDLPLQYENTEFYEVQVVVRGGRGGYPYGVANHVINVGGTKYGEWAPTLHLGAGFAYRQVSSGRYLPDSSIWDYTKVNNMKAGVRLYGAASYGQPSVDVVYVRVFDLGSMPVVGGAPVERCLCGLTGGTTYINRFNPSTVSGTVRYVELFLSPTYDPQPDVKIAVFYKVGGDNPPGNGFYTTRSWVNIGTVPTGASKHLVALPIEVGDFIGWYTTSSAGRICFNYTFNPAVEGAVMRSGDNIPCTNAEFEKYQHSEVWNYVVMSLRGLIE